MPINTVHFSCTPLAYGRVPEYWIVFDMFRSGHCRHCGVPIPDVLCNSCREFRRCTRRCRYLPEHLYSTESGVCNACQHRDEKLKTTSTDIALIVLLEIEHGPWSRTSDDIDVSTFIQHHQKDITVTFEAARNENEAIKYYLEMEVELYHTGQEGDVQHTTTRFYILPMTSDVDELNLPDIITQFMEKMGGFSGQNSDWIISQINYLPLCWGCYRPLMAGTFIPTPKFLESKHALVNIQCFDDDNCFQYSVLAGMNIIKSSWQQKSSSTLQAVHAYVEYGWHSDTSTSVAHWQVREPESRNICKRAVSR